MIAGRRCEISKALRQRSSAIRFPAIGENANSLTERGNAAFLRRSEAEVALLRLLQLQGRTFDPAVVNVMLTAFDDTLRELKLTSRHDPLVERVAQIIIECAENGMRDVAEMRDCALKAIRNGAEH